MLNACRLGDYGQEGQATVQGQGWEKAGVQVKKRGAHLTLGVFMKATSLFRPLT